MTGPVLRMKSLGVNGTTCSCVDSSNLVMMGAIKNAKLHRAWRDHHVFGSDRQRVRQLNSHRGGPRAKYFRPQGDADHRSDQPRMQTWKANMTKYIPSYKGSFPNYGVTQQLHLR